MKKDESTFDIDFNFGEEKEEEVTITEEIFISSLVDPKFKFVDTYNLHGTLRIICFKVEASKDYLKNSKFIMCKFPVGTSRILGHLSVINSNVKNFCVGWSSFKNRKNQKISGFEDGILTDKNAGIFGKSRIQSVVFDSLEGIEVYATFKSDGKKGDFIEGIFVYVKK